MPTDTPTRERTVRLFVRDQKVATPEDRVGLVKEWRWVDGVRWSYNVEFPDSGRRYAYGEFELAPVGPRMVPVDRLIGGEVVDFIPSPDPGHDRQAGRVQIEDVNPLQTGGWHVRYSHPNRHKLNEQQGLAAFDGTAGGGQAFIRDPSLLFPVLYP
jgi:hypothetical protein